MRIVVVSATSVIAQACIKAWAVSGSHNFVLVGRSEEKLLAVAADLRLRFPSSNFDIALADFTSASSIAKMAADLGEIKLDLVLVAQGSLTKQSKASGDLDYLQAELEVNAVSVALVAEAFAGVLEKQNSGTLGLIGSVAGDRGRAYNYSYGSSKALIETYSEGLQQRFAATKVAICLIKPGPTATPMTATHSGKMAEPEIVGKAIVAGLQAKRRIIYAPGIWRYVMFIVRNIPFSIFKRLKF